MSRQDSIWFWQQHPEKSFKKYVRMTQKRDNKLALLYVNRKRSFFDKKCQNITAQLATNCKTIFRITIGQVEHKCQFRILKSFGVHLGR